MARIDRAYCRIKDHVPAFAPIEFCSWRLVCKEQAMSSLDASSHNINYGRQHATAEAYNMLERKFNYCCQATVCQLLHPTGKLLTIRWDADVTVGYSHLDAWGGGQQSRAMLPGVTKVTECANGFELQVDHCHIPLALLKSPGLHLHIICRVTLEIDPHP